MDEHTAHLSILLRYSLIQFLLHNTDCIGYSIHIRGLGAVIEWLGIAGVLVNPVMFACICTIN